jgi:hypothetical protein
MAFSFLNPWLWLGAVTVALPLWLHLRRKPDKNPILFSAVRFLQNAAPIARQPRRIENVLLFALRALLLLLLSAAFAWPYLRPPNKATANESRVYIVDGTLSTQVERRFEQERDLLLRTLERTPVRTEISVVHLTAQPAEIVPFRLSREEAISRVRALKPSHQRGSYTAAFQIAAGLLADSIARHKRIVLLGDSQANQWASARKPGAMFPDLSLKGIEVDLPPSPTALPNTSISAERVVRLFAGDTPRVGLTIRLSHTGPPAKARFLVRSDSRAVYTRELTLGPGAVILQCEWDVARSGPVLGEAEVVSEHDALAADDRLYFALPPAAEGTVAFLGRSVYLRAGLSPRVLRGNWKTEDLDPHRLPDRPSADVFCLESEFLPVASRLVAAYQASGRGVLLFVNALTPAVKGALLQLGVSTEDAVSVGNSQGESLQVVAPQHRILKLFNNTDFGDLSEVRFFSYARLNCPAAIALLCSQSGVPLFFECQRAPGILSETVSPPVNLTPPEHGETGTGKLYLAAFGMDRNQTLWPVHPTFVPFLDLCLQAAANASDTAAESLLPGETGSILLKQAEPVPHLAIFDAVNQGKAVSNVTVVNERALFKAPDTPGLYRLSSEVSLSQSSARFFAVNPAPEESELTYENGTRVINEWQRNSPNSHDVQPPRTPPQLSSILNQRLWWWLLVTALALVFTETVFANRPGPAVS